MNAKAARITAFQNNVEERDLASPSVHSFSLSRAQHSKVRVNNPSSTWIDDLKERFDELVSLPVGWDGYTGKPVSFTCAQFAANLIERLYDELLPPPNLIPGSDGTLQIEWHRNHFDIEIDVLAPYQVIATRYDCKSGRQEEFDLDSDFTLLADWLSELGESNRAAA